MKKHIAIYLIGLIFGLGISISGMANPAMRRSKLVLPLPFAPVSKSASPGDNANDRPLKTSRPPRIQAKLSPVNGVNMDKLVWFRMFVRIKKRIED